MTTETTMAKALTADDVFVFLLEGSEDNTLRKIGTVRTDGNGDFSGACFKVRWETALELERRDLVGKWIAMVGDGLNPPDATDLFGWEVCDDAAAAGAAVVAMLQRQAALNLYSTMTLEGERATVVMPGQVAVFDSRATKRATLLKQAEEHTAVYRLVALIADADPDKADVGEWIASARQALGRAS